MLEIDPQNCAVDRQLCRAIDNFSRKTKRNPAIPELDGITEQFWYDGPTEWKYDQIIQTGSAELQELVFLVTGGVAPGGKEKERDAS